MKRAFLFWFLALLPLPVPGWSQTAPGQITVAWDPNVEPDVAGYRLHVGTASREYTQAIDVGNVTTNTLVGLDLDQFYYVAVTTLDTSGLESDYSNEVSCEPVWPPPSVTFTAPADGVAFTAPAAIPLSASVSPIGHTLHEVQFYQGDALLGTSTSAPYRATWNNVAAGTYSLTAQVIYDADLTATSSAVVVLVTNPPPVIVLSAPAEGTTYTAPAVVGLRASVVPNWHVVRRVEFYQGTDLLGSAASAPYRLTWDNVKAGDYRLGARLVYDNGAMMDSAPVNFSALRLRSPWRTVEIGRTGVLGSAGATNGVFLVRGAGTLGGTADSFRFVYQTGGDSGEIVARLQRTDQTDAAGRIGVMVRETLTTGSRYVFLGLAPDGVIRSQSRVSTGAASSSSVLGTATTPNVWFCLERTADGVSLAWSTDNRMWSSSYCAIALAPSTCFGLAVASGSLGLLNTTVFTGVSMIPNAPE